MACNFPYVETNGTCTQTYAEALGGGYKVYKTIYAILAIIITVASLVQLFRFKFYMKIKEYSTLFILIMLSVLMSIMMLIQSLDPQGYSGILPFIVENVASNMTTCLGLIIIFKIMFTFIWALKLIKPYEKRNLNFLFIMISMVLIFTTLLFSYLQVYVNRYLYRGIKLLLFSTVTAIISIKLNQIVIISINNLKLFQTNKKTIKRYMYYIILFDILIVFSVIYMFYSSVVSFTKINDSMTPILDSDRIIFPICQFLSIVLALSFSSKFHIKKPRETIITPKIDFTKFFDSLNNLKNSLIEKLPHKKNDTVVTINPI